MSDGTDQRMLNALRGGQGLQAVGKITDLNFPDTC
jgi:hypothetical protein